MGNGLKKVLDPVGIFKRWDDPPSTGPAATDPTAERRAAEAEAAAAANARTAELTRQRRQQSLLAAGANADQGRAQTSSALAMGKGRFGD